MTLSSLLPERIRQVASRATQSPQHWRRPSLLSLMAAAAGVAAVANAMASATAAPVEQSEPTRLGTSIQQSMRDRDEALAGQKRALDLREQAQRAAEQRLRAEIQANQGAAPQQVAGGAKGSDQPDIYDGLARIYQTMKPARAAPIFEKLDLEVQTQVVHRMRDRSTALILASMSPSAAVELSMALAGRHVIKAPPPKPVAATPAPPPAPEPRRETRAERRTRLRAERTAQSVPARKRKASVAAAPPQPAADTTPAEPEQAAAPPAAAGK
jgi:flagellar motility protein MotE (MotC chaperone)